MTAQQQEGRWEKTGATTIRVGAKMTIHVPHAKGTYKSDCEALLDQIIRDHGQADVAEALRAENARLREALEATIWSNMSDRDLLANPSQVISDWLTFRAEFADAEHHGDCTGEPQPCGRCQVEMVLLAALDAAPEEKQG